MIIIPEVINTILMGLIFMVIVITIVRPLMLNMVHEYSGPNVQDAIIDEIELEVARLAEQHSQRNSALIEFHRQLLIAPPRPERKSSEPSVAHDDDNDVDLFGLRAELDQAKAQAEQARLEAEEKARLEEELKQQEAAALAEQGPRLGQPGQIRADCRGYPADRADRHLGAERGLPSGRGLAAAGQGGGQCLG